MKLPRRRAMMVAGLAGVTTLMAGSAVLVAGAQSGSGSVLGAARDSTNTTSVVTEVQYDDTYAVVVPDPSATAGSDGAAPSAGADPTESVAPDPSTVTTAAHHADDPTTVSEPAPEHGPKPTTVPRPTTTPTTAPTTERGDSHDGSGGVETPDDGHAARPAPPIPAGCVHPQLEDSGQWNCEH
jgi:hypothetical protein